MTAPFPGNDPRLSRVLSNVRGVAWPAISGGLAGAVLSLLRNLDETQWLGPDQLRQAQLLQLRILARTAARTSPAFAARLAGAGLAPEDLAEPGGLQQLPPLTRRALQAAGDDLFCTEVPKGHEPVNALSTSGSTGEPVTIRRTWVSQVMWSAMTVRDHLWRGLDFMWRLSVSRPTINEYGERGDWGAPVSLLYRSGPLQRIPSTFSIAEMAERLVAFSPNVLIVYPSVLRGLVDHFRERRLRLPDLRLVHCISETLPPSLRAEATDVLRVRIWDTYSSQELGNIATQCPASDLLHVMAESTLVEVLDERGEPCKEGEVGRVVATDLHNFATPLIRYDIGDYAEVGGPCSCGRGLPTLARIVGRERNLVLMPDGSRHWPMLGFHRFGEVAPIRQYQVIQRERDLLEVRMVNDGPISAEQESALGRVIQEAVGHPFALRFEWFDDHLPVGPGGKFEEFRCEVAPD